MIAFFIELLDLPGFEPQDKIFGANAIYDVIAFLFRNGFILT